jgi:hypothetical protein
MMKKVSKVFTTIIIVILCTSILTQITSFQVNCITEMVTIDSCSKNLADGDTENLIIPVWKNEAVLNNSADTNFHGDDSLGGLWVGLDGTSGLARSYVSFDLTNVPKDLAFVSARFCAFMSGEFSTGAGNDTPIGVYYCANDLWDETTITWNNQPSFSDSPSDVIDSPASPNTFILHSWYSWDITGDVRQALSGDKLLTEVMRNVDENALPGSGKGFAKWEYYQFNATYISISYTTPSISQIAVEGHTSLPLLYYIQDSTPMMSWIHEDNDNNDMQYGYELEVWNDPLYNETNLWTESSTSIQPVFYENSSIHDIPFATDAEVRMQFKYDSTILNRSGMVDKLHFYVVQDEGALTFENLVVRLASTSVSGALAASFEANYGTASPVIVLSRDSYEADIHNSILTIDVENMFVLSHDLSLIIEIRFTGLDGILAVSEIDATSSIGWVAYEYGPGDYTATTAGFLSPRCYSFDIEFASVNIYQTEIGGSLNAYPFNTDNGEAGRVVFKYNNSLISESGFLDKLYFRVASGGTDIIFDDFEVYLCETPLLGRLANGTWSENYGEQTLTQVLNEATYTVRNLGDVLVIDVENTFYYNNEMELLIELRWDSKVSGSASCRESMDAGGYRAYDVSWGGTHEGNDTATYHMFADFIQPVNEIEYAGMPLVNMTTYFWRVRTCDSIGIWTSWSEQSYTYQPLSATPEWEGLEVSPSPVSIGKEVQVSINVTFFLGINEVTIEYDGSNHTMSNSGVTYSYSWFPELEGIVDFTIYMESSIGTWSVAESSFLVSRGLDIILLFIIGGSLTVVLVGSIFLRKRKKLSK